MEDDGDGLSRFEIGKIDLAGFMNNDKSLEVQIKLKSVSLDDIRPDSNLAIKRLVIICHVKVRGPFVQTLCIEKYSYMDAI